MSSEPSAVTLEHERALWGKGMAFVAGVDEAGRGPLAGPVVAAAVVFEREFILPDVNDSKVLPEAMRETLFAQIMDRALAVGVGVVDHTTIDEINILNATFRAMHMAIDRLAVTPDHVLIDGNRFDGGAIPYTTIIDGDAQSFCIAAASIIAKVTRDRLMNAYDVQFPGYGFARHKGYATREHCEAIRRLGYSAIHRRSFALATDPNQLLIFQD